MFIGFGTLANVVTVVLGSTLGMVIGNRFPARTEKTVLDALGLVTILLGALSVVDVLSPSLSEAVGDQAPVLIVLGGLLIGAVIGSLLNVEAATERFGMWVRRTLTRSTPDQESEPTAADVKFVNGFVSASLLFCVGPLTVLGSLMEGLGRGPDQLLVKALLDGFASIAFAASLGAGVLASAATVLLVQGSLTLIGWAIGDVLPEPHLMGLSAVGGLILAGLGMRLLNIKQVPVANMLPALIVAPLLVQLVIMLR